MRRLTKHVASGRHVGAPRGLALLALYVTFVSEPVFHRMYLAAFDVPAVSALAATSGPVLSPACDGGCADPSHRHAPPHDRHHCVLCRVADASHVLPVAMDERPTRGDESIRLLHVSTRVVVTACARAYPARAPPASSIG